MEWITTKIGWLETNKALKVDDWSQVCCAVMLCNTTQLFINFTYHAYTSHNTRCSCPIRDWWGFISNHNDSIQYMVRQIVKQLQGHTMYPTLNTPLIAEAWRQYLTHHPNQLLTYFFLKGLREGFHIGFNSHLLPNLKSSRRNWDGAIQQPIMVYKYLWLALSTNQIS